MSAKAVIGILKRAQKRNKELPFALKEALIQQSGMRGDYYGEKEITYAGEILRSVWSEAGTEAFVEWVRRTALLVQQKKILFADMQYDSAEEEKIKCASYESKNQQTESEGDCAGSSMCGLWEDWLYRGSSCGLKSHEQLVRKLGEVMQKLSCQKTPYALFMRCLWIASEGTSSMWQALASVEEIEFERLGHAIHEENKRDFERKCEINTPLLFDVRISSDGTHNWRAHCYETDKSRSLDTHAPDPDTNHGGVAILEDVNLSTVGGQNEITIYDMTHAQDVIRENKQAPTLTQRMGTGGNQVPILTENIPSFVIMGHDERSARFHTETTDPLTACDYKQPPIVATIVFEPGVATRDGGHVYTDGKAPTLRANPGDNMPTIMSTAGGADVLECKQSRPHGEVFQKHSRSVDGNGLERRTCTCNGKQTVGSLCAHDGRGFNGQDAANDKLIIEHYETNNDS